jgi:ketosteroid isomerase-like protein
MMNRSGPYGPATTAIKKSIETGDRADYVALLAPNAVTWHNSDNLVVTTSRDPVSVIPGRIENARMDITYYAAFDGGEVAQYTLRGRARATGRAVEAYLCIIFTMGDEGITRLDEYGDVRLARALGQEEQYSR